MGAKPTNREIAIRYMMSMVPATTAGPAVPTPANHLASESLSSKWSSEDRGMVFYIQNGVIMAHKKMGAAVKNSEKRKHEKSVKTDVKSQN